MVLGTYPSEALYQLISLADVEAAMDRWKTWDRLHGSKPPSGVRPHGSLDVGDQGPDDTILTMKYGSWVAPQLESPKFGDPVKEGEWAGDILNQNAAYDCKVDGTGVGAGCVTPIKRKGIQQVHKIMVQSKDGLEEIFDADLGLFYSVRDAMLFGLREWLKNDPGAMLPPSNKLKEELVAPTYEKRKGEIKVMDSDTLTELLGRSPDRLMSLALQFAPIPRKNLGGFGQANYVTGEHKVLKPATPTWSRGNGIRQA
jgi:hypothetical protein